MNRILKYFIIMIIFFIITYAALVMPKIYFNNMDEMMLENISRNNISLSNIYDNYNLTTIDKINIIFSDHIQLLGHDSPNRENYEKTIAILDRELKKVDENLYKKIFAMIDLNFKNVMNFNIEIDFLSSEDLDKSLVLRYVNIETKDYNLYFFNDVYDDQLLAFSLDIHSNSFDDKIFDGIEEKYSKYLNAPTRFVQGFCERNMLSFNIKTDKYNQEIDTESVIQIPSKRVYDLD